LYILGINLSHDSSAALIKDGKVLNAIEEERFNRERHTDRFPDKSINWVLSQEGISIDRVDYIVTSFDFKKFENSKLPFEGNTISHDELNAEGQSRIKMDNNLFYWTIARNLEKRGINKWIGIDHHLSHAAGAYFLSGFDEANILVLDGRSENQSTTLFFGENGAIKKIMEYPVNDSLGHLYSYVTDLCGLYSNIGQEGKTMGLAPYGFSLPNLEEIFSKILKINDRDDTPNFTIDRNTMRELKKYSRPLGEIDNISKSLAFHVQHIYEKALLILARNIYSITRCNNFALSGGVALNCEGNRLLAKQSFVDKIYVQPAANDAGTSIGAALYFYSTLADFRPKRQEDVYLGPEYTDKEIEELLDLYGLKYTKVDNPEFEAAKLLSNGEIIGWFQGKMEFGPRALGNRSILADPRCIETKTNINKFIKFRENWRPFAPSILYDKMHEYFEDVYESPHMTISNLVKKEKRSKIPAAIHIDGTARIQTVTKESNKKYYNLIENFYQLTGVPVVLNTSFNGPEPMVCSPKDAIRTFYSSGLNTVILGNYMLNKEQSPL
jgi:carbamoyltransferase